MTFDKWQEQTFDIVSKQSKPLWNNILNAYRKAQKEIEKELSDVYAKYLATADPKDYYNLMIKKDRLTGLLKNVNKAFTDATKKAGVNIVNSSTLGISNAYYGSQYKLSWITPLAGVDISFSILPVEVINASVYGTAEAWTAIQKKAIQEVFGDPLQYFRQQGSLTKLLLDQKNEALIKIQQSITTGLIQGKSYTKVISDVKDIIGRELFRGGVKSYSGVKGLASRIVRTENIRNYNAGTLASYNYAKSEGVDIKKQWLATLDSRTRNSHASADGQIREIEEDFNINGATGKAPGQLNIVSEVVNCRCTTISVIGDVDGGVRRGVNPNTGKTEAFTFTSFNDWMDLHNLKANNKGIIKQV